MTTQRISNGFDLRNIAENVNWRYKSCLPDEPADLVRLAVGVGDGEEELVGEAAVVGLLLDLEDKDRPLGVNHADQQLGET